MTTLNGLLTWADGPSRRSSSPPTSTARASARLSAAYARGASWSSVTLGRATPPSPKSYASDRHGTTLDSGTFESGTPVRDRRPRNTPEIPPATCITTGHTCPQTCPLILKRRTAMQSRTSQRQDPQEPLPGMTLPTDLSRTPQDQKQNPRSHLSRTAPGQRGRSNPAQKGPDLSLSPPLSRGDRSGTAPAHPKNHTPKTTPCNPHCITCHQPEDRGNCTPNCATICNHTLGPHTTHICITQTRAHAHTTTSPNSGRTLTLVPNCPHCGNAHIHAGHANPHRTAPCGRPYILRTTS